MNNEKTNLNRNDGVEPNGFGEANAVGDVGQADGIDSNGNLIEGNNGLEEIGKNMKKKRQKRSRIWEIDFLRGLCILLVVMDHTFFDIYSIHGMLPYQTEFALGFQKFTAWYWGCDWRMVIQPFIVYVFIFLSGISCSMSRSNILRALKMLALSGFMTLVTYWATSIIKVARLTIMFNVLHVIALCVLLWSIVEVIEVLVNKFSKSDKQFKIPAIILVLLGIAAVLVGETFKYAYKYGTEMAFVPKNSESMELWLFWTHSIGGMTADFQPIFPNVGYFLLGAVFGRMHYKEKVSLFPKFKSEKYGRFVCFCGRNTLWFYLGGQVVAFALIFGLAYLL